LYSYLSERFAAASSSSPVLRDANPAKLHLILMHTSAALFGGRLASREEVAALPLEALEGAVANALRDFPSWAKPKAPPVRVSPVQRLEDANAEVAAREARKAAQQRGEQPAPAPAVAKAKLNALPAHMRLAAANGDRQLSHLIEAKK
jgi:hypothetical protein